MYKKHISLLSFVLVLSLACASYGFVVSDFEIPGWYVNNWDSPPGTINTSTIGATSGSQSLRIFAPRGGWTIAALVKFTHVSNPALYTPEEFLPKYLASATVEMDITIDPADWVGAGNNFKVMAVINSQKGGWQDQGTPQTDSANPIAPGYWDPVNFPALQTRHISWDITDTHAALANGGGDWFELFMIIQSDGYPNGGAIYIDNVQFVEPPTKVIFVTDTPDIDADGNLDDQGWIDWLVAEGYNVDARRANWQVLDPNKIAELNAAGVIILSRGINTGNYNQAGEPNQWSGLTAPVINLNVWLVRNNRMKWMNSADARKDAGSPPMMVLDPNNPIFAGLTIDADGLVEVLDQSVGSGGTSFLFDILDVGNGTLLAQALGLYNTAWVAEWPAGVEYYTGAGLITGGKRIMFSAGSQDGVPGQTTPTPQGAFNLNDEGQKLMRNIISYLAP